MLDRTASLIVTGALVVGAMGCRPSAHEPIPQVSAEGRKYLLAAEPPGAIGVAQAAQELTEAAPAQERELVIVGRIPHDIGEGQSPWNKEGAMFALVDADAPGHACSGHDHDHEQAERHEQKQEHAHQHANCPFHHDAAAAAAPIAFVKIVDAHGQLLKTDARRLLGLAIDQVVVARGMVKRDSLGYLHVTADGAFVRPEEAAQR